jgi:hypothetical protein
MIAQNQNGYDFEEKNQKHKQVNPTHCTRMLKIEKGVDGDMKWRYRLTL